jgi:hypothetical protein
VLELSNKLACFPGIFCELRVDIPGKKSGIIDISFHGANTFEVILLSEFSEGSEVISAEWIISGVAGIAVGVLSDAMASFFSSSTSISYIIVHKKK